jgi:hypothetical protein
MTNDFVLSSQAHSTFQHSDLIRHSDFDIRHSPLLSSRPSSSATAAAASAAWGASGRCWAFGAGFDVGGDDHTDGVLPTGNRTVLGAIIIVMIVFNSGER